METNSKIIEEAAEQRFPSSNKLSLNSSANYGFIEGAKWQLERSYSFEEMRTIIISFWEQFPEKWDIEAWINKHKK